MILEILPESPEISVLHLGCKSVLYSLYYSKAANTEIFLGETRFENWGGGGYCFDKTFRKIYVIGTVLEQ